MLKKISDEYNFSIDILRQELASIETNIKKDIIPPKEEVPVKRKNKYEIGIYHILYFMMNDAKYIKMYKSKLGFFDNPIYRGIANAAKDKKESKLKKEIYEVIENVKDEELNETIMEEYLTTVKKVRKEHEIEDLKRKVKNELDINRKIALVSRIQELKKEV